MNKQSFLKKAFLALLCTLLVFTSGCDSIGNDNQITQMNEAFLPDVTDSEEALWEKEVSSQEGSIAPKENRQEGSGTSVSDSGSGNNTKNSSNGNNPQNSNEDGSNGNSQNSSRSSSNGNSTKNSAKNVDNGNSSQNSDENSSNGNIQKDNSSQNTSNSQKSNTKNGNNDNNQKSSIQNRSNGNIQNSSQSSSDGNGSKNGDKSGKPHKNTAEPVPTKKPQPTPAPEGKQRLCTISIDCLTILDNMDKLNSAKKPFVPENGIILPETSVTFQQGDTVFDILSRVCREREIHMEASYTPLYGTYYVEGIHQLYEFDCGKDMSGWKYFVNGVSVNYSCSKYKVKAGDTICWSYTCDGGRDLESVPK